MIHAFDKTYLDSTMSCLGAMLDYAVNSCQQELSLFYEQFLRSGVAQQIERGNPRYLCGLSGVEMAHLVAIRTGSPLPEANPLIDMGSPEYWTGWTLAYLQWHFGRGFKSLYQAGVGVDTLIQRYASLHEADLSKAVRFAQKSLERNQVHFHPLKEQRRNMHLTQQELSTLSGVSLRAIRAYEQSQLSLSNAGAASIVRLARVLGCTPADLLE